jgi:hypothetical protein
MSVETGRYRVERRGYELVVVDAWTGRVEGEDGYDTRYPSSRRAVLRFVARLEKEQSDGRETTPAANVPRVPRNVLHGRHAAHAVSNVQGGPTNEQHSTGTSQ